VKWLVQHKNIKIHKELEKL